MQLLVVISCVLLSVHGIKAEDPGDFHKCIKDDSISCLQMTIFRRAKSFFDKSNIELFGGVSLTKPADSRQGKSIDDNSVAVESANSVEERNNEIESYFMTNAKNFLQERSLSINFGDVARSIAKRIPDDFKSDLRDLVVEGRGKLVRRKLMKKVMLIMTALKVKFGLLAMASLIGLLFVAKKALFISIIAFAISAFNGFGLISRNGGGGGGIGSGSGSGGGIWSGLGNLFGGGGSSQYSSGGSGAYAQPGGWSSGGGGGGGAAYSSYGGGGGWGGGWDSHGSYSSPVAQTIAYSGHKQARR